MEGTINNVFSEPDVEILDVRYFPVKALTRIPVVAAAVDGRAVNFYFSGLYNFLRAKMKVTSLDLQREYLIVMSNIRNLFYDDQHFWGRFWGDTAPRKLEGTFDVAFSPEGIHTRVYAPDLFRGELSWGFLPDAPLKGKVHIRHFSVADYLANSPMLAAVLQEGALRGEMTIAGTVQEPHIEFDLEAGDFIINQVGYYNARLIGRLQNHRLDLERLIMQLNDETVMQADLHWDMLRDSLEAVIAAQQAESNFLAETLFRRDDLIRGPFGYIIQVSGSSRRPRISGTLQVKNGEFLGKPFTVATLAFEDSLPPDVSPWQISHHIIRIQNFYYDIPQEYHLRAEGIVGIGEAGPLDIRIQAAGNILAELPRLEPYFINPKVNGTLSVWLKGTRSNFVFKDAEVHITRGHLEFDGVIPPVDSLHADIQLDSTTRFVSVNIEGLVDGRRARIFNQPSVTVEGRVLEPWEFEDIGINLGILALETDPRGIPLSIPGLMEPGDIGYFAASGRQPGEHFYLAGPSPRILHPGFEQDGEKFGSQKFPLCRGTITLYNARVTFPFIGLEEDTEEENPVVDFLINMQWDVLAQPGNNVRYFVRIPAYVGEVFMDLNIDNDSPGLEFLGRLADEPWLLEETPEHQQNGFAQFSGEIENSDSPQWSPGSTEPISYLKQPMFRIKGAVESTRGRVEYLDANFRVERFGAEFHELEIYPEVYGRAYTTVRDSTSELPIDIYLVLYVVDPVTKQEVSKGRWEDFRFKLVSSNQVSSNGIIKETQEQVLAYLGYSPANLRQKAGEVGLTVTGNYLIRPLIRPLERQLERRLGLDYVRFRSHFASNLFYLSLQNRIKLFSRPVGANPFLTGNNLDPTLILLQSSEVTLGKYLFRDLYFSYTGQVVSGYEESRLGLNHTFELEYRIVRNFLLEIEYSRFQFNPFYREGVPYDFRIQLRHSFNF
ncbi:MAG: hypothetical protein D6681_05840 [Calditrichaeota bacterium]|nr:MAG: hypothetical protein D6681_05840 [Calditrichota bacterium]